MSFLNKGFWMPREAGSLTDGEKGYDNSRRIEPKRSHQWFNDGAGTELFSNKKQAIEAHESRPVPGISHTNVPQWNRSSSFRSDRLFGSEPVRTVNLLDRSTPFVHGGSLNAGRMDFQDQYNNVSTDLSLSLFEDPSHFNLGGIRKVKVNQVRDSGTGLSASTRLSYVWGDNSSLSMGTTFNKRDNSTMSLGPNNFNLDNNILSMGRSFSKSDISLFSMGHTLNKGEYHRRNDNISLMGLSFGKGDGSFLSLGQPSEKRESNLMSMSSYNKEPKNFMSIGQTYDKANEKFTSVGSAYNKGSDNPIGQTCDKVSENFISVSSSYNKGSGNPIGMPLAYDKPDSNITPVGSTQDKGYTGVLSMGETNTVSFGGYQDEPKSNSYGNPSLLIGTQNSAEASQEPSLLIGARNSAEASQKPSSLIGAQNSAEASQVPRSLIGAQNSAEASQEPRSLIGAQISAEASQEPNSLIGGAQTSAKASQKPNLLIGSQNSAQASQEPSQPNLVEPNVDSTVNNIPATNPRTVTAPKPKTAKKAPANNISSNVKSLLSTGMLDGIRVKYVSWSREKSLKGIIKGAGYLCGCSNCNYTKALTAYEFQRHANCKTRHPTNHIYFENGKTVFGVVQELRNTPQDKLVDAVQNVIGSQINQKNYRIWKASCQAANP